jgi:hypothetical protein
MFYQTNRSTWRLRSLSQSAFDQTALIAEQSCGQTLKREPFRVFDFQASLPQVAARPATKNNLDLRRSSERSHEGQFRTLYLQADLFAQLAPDGFFGLFAPLYEAAWNAPGVARTKDVFEQQNAILRVEHDRSGCHRKAWLDEPHTPATHALRRDSPQSPEQLFQHARTIYRVKGKR